MPRGRPRQNIRTYNLNRRLGSLKRQQSHYARMVSNAETRLSQVKQRLDSVSKQISDTERQLRQPSFPQVTSWQLTENFMTNKVTPKLCVLCGHPIKLTQTESGWWTQGHNSEPVAEGRCCEDCHQNYVLSARLRQHQQTIKKINES